MSNIEHARVFINVEECRQMISNNEVATLAVAYKGQSNFEKNHLPQAQFMDTLELESEANGWNIFPSNICREAFLRHGITSDRQLLIYSDDPSAASRVALIALFLGIDRVLILDGGLSKWMSAGYPMETGSAEPIVAPTDFGNESDELRQKFVITDSEDVLKARAANPDLVLASCRSWDEFTGKVSGYDYIKQLGEPQGAVYAKTSIGKGDTAFLLNDDSTVKQPDDIFGEWAKNGISADKQVVFYCGTGWRASTALLICWQAGWDNVQLFDGGAYDWFKHNEKDPEKYPIQIGGEQA